MKNPLLLAVAIAAFVSTEKDGERADMSLATDLGVSNKAKQTVHRKQKLSEHIRLNKVKQIGT